MFYLIAFADSKLIPRAIGATAAAVARRPGATNSTTTPTRLLATFRYSTTNPPSSWILAGITRRSREANRAVIPFWLRAASGKRLAIPIA